MTQSAFPPMVLKDWKETRDTLHKYCRMVGAIREALSPPLPHSFQTNLLIEDAGFTTSEMSKSIEHPEQTLEVIIDIIHRRLLIKSDFWETCRIALTGQSLNALCDETCSLLTDMGVKPPLEKPSFIEGMRGRFDPSPLLIYREIICAVNEVLNELKTEIKGETSRVYLRPDDFAVVLTWYSGSPGNADDKFEHQVDFAFLTGDERFPDAYFYITAFPDYRKLKKLIPEGNPSRFSEKYSGMLLPYTEVIASDNPRQMLLGFYRSVLPAFAGLVS